MVTKQDSKKFKSLVKLADLFYRLKNRFPHIGNDIFAIKVLGNNILFNDKLIKWLKPDFRLCLIDRREKGYVLITPQKFTDDCIDIYVDSNGICETSDAKIRQVKNMFNITETDNDKIIKKIIGVGMHFENFAIAIV